MLIRRPSMILGAALLIAACIAGDRMTKTAATSLRGQMPVVCAGGIMTLSYAENSGAVLSLGAGLPERTRFLLFTAGAGILLAGVAGFLLFSPGLTRAHVTALSLILAGGGGNLFDRLSHDGRVVDFVTLGAGGIRTGIFNLADLMIIAGTSLLVITMFRQQRDNIP